MSHIAKCFEEHYGCTKDCELTPRPKHVLVESFPDDLRGAPITSAYLRGMSASFVAPGKYAESSRLATVVSVGRGVLDLKPGDIVLSGRYPHSAWAVHWQGRELISIAADELLAKLEVN